VFHSCVLVPRDALLSPTTAEPSSAAPSQPRQRVGSCLAPAIVLPQHGPGESRARPRARLRQQLGARARKCSSRTLEAQMSVAAGLEKVQMPCRINQGPDLFGFFCSSLGTPLLLRYLLETPACAARFPLPPRQPILGWPILGLQHR